MPQVGGPVRSPRSRGHSLRLLTHHCQPSAGCRPHTVSRPPEPPRLPSFGSVLGKKDDLPPKLGRRNLLYPTVRFSKPGRDSLSLLLTSLGSRLPCTRILEKEAGLVHTPVHT